MEPSKEQTARHRSILVPAAWQARRIFYKEVRTFYKGQTLERFHTALGHWCSQKGEELSTERGRNRD